MGHIREKKLEVDDAGNSWLYDSKFQREQRCGGEKQRTSYTYSLGVTVSIIPSESKTKRLTAFICICDLWLKTSLSDAFISAHEPRLKDYFIHFSASLGTRSLLWRHEINKWENQFSSFSTLFSTCDSNTKRRRLTKQWSNGNAWLLSLIDWATRIRLPFSSPDKTTARYSHTEQQTHKAAT